MPSYAENWVVYGCPEGPEARPELDRRRNVRHKRCKGERQQDNRLVPTQNHAVPPCSQSQKTGCRKGGNGG